MTTGSRGSMIVSFDNIKLLEHPDDWIQWEKEMKQTLKAARYNDLLSRNRTTPTIEDGETVKDFRDRLTTWKDKQEQAVAIVEKRCGPDAEKHIASLSQSDDAFPTVEEVFATLERHYKPSGSAYFRDLDRQYQELRLADCKDVTDFAQRLSHAYHELVALDASVELSEHFLVNKFLNGLGEDYDNFITAFEQNHCLLPLRNAEKVITTAAVSFSTVRKAVQEEEHKKKVRREESTAFLSRAKPPRPSIRRKECTDCGRLGHMKEECWETHPELKKAHDIKRKRKKGKEAERGTDKRARFEGGDEGEEDRRKSVMLARHQDHCHGSGFLAVDDKNADDDVFANAVTERTAIECSWVLDSGASTHMTCRLDDFVDDYEAFPPGSMQTINGVGGSRLRTAGSGTVRVQCRHEGRMVGLRLEKVLYCPELGANLVSISRLLQSGAQVDLQVGGATVTAGSTVVTAVARQGLWMLDL